MTYEEAMAYIKKTETRGMSLGLYRMRELCRRLGDPQKKLSIIHIAGTNGKGSTAAYISSILGVSGYLTGRYVSPAVFQYEECIQYEDKEGVHYIDPELLAALITRVASVSEQMASGGMEAPTSFEMETAVAFLAFCHWQCRAVILEVGLGGEEDATNVIDKPLLSVITPISRDHREILGDTVEDIARHKAGIIKEGGTVIAYQREKRIEQVLAEQAKKKGAALTLLKKDDMMRISADDRGMLFSYQGETFRTGMSGTYQIENACLALETCRHLPLSYSVTIEQQISGIRRAVWRGRFEVVSTEPLIILDGAHNPDGAKALAESIGQLLPDRVRHGIMGVFRDKEYKKMVSYLAPLLTDIVTITAPGERGLPKEILAEAFRRNGCPLVTTAQNVSLALKEVRKRCKKEEVILIFGSLSFFKELPWHDFHGNPLKERENS